MATESFFLNMIITEDTYESFCKVINRNKKIKVEDHSHVVRVSGEGAAEDFLKFTNTLCNDNDENL